MTQIITTHKNADFDAFASLVAASLIYPKAVVAIPKNINANVKAFISIHKDIFDYTDRWDIQTGRVTRLIVVDTSDWNRLGPLFKLKDKPSIEVILWDHHLHGNIDAHWACIEPIGATITLLVRELKALKKPITPIQATLFLAGLYEDTGNLSFSSSTAEDAYTAGWLLDQKADLSLVNRFLRPAYGEKQKDILFEMLRNTNRLKVNGYAISISQIPIEGHISNLALVVRMFRDIINVDAAFGVFTNQEKNGKSRCMVIGRSDNESLDVGTLMKSMGGGGHPGAGSAMLKGVNPDVVQQMIIDLIEGNQQSSVQISDLMSFPVFTIPPETTMADVSKILQEHGCTGLLVVDKKDKLLGVISRRDFKKIRKVDQLQSPVKAFMSTHVITIGPGKSPSEAAKIMVRHDIGRLPVVEDEKIIGIITRSDAMTYFYDLLPD
ncbi:CBS domain-containing protein [Desulfosarcina sp. OttesenSCG-928-A07]|nr:CBS domain-containing protein [Desulfosarcina sp. OttesenSCG-928-G17]MDL2330146.1 CBS domain-containing protein [Desulfosarcina sp. OttesenSCG-928-A07]